MAEEDSSRVEDLVDTEDAEESQTTAGASGTDGASPTLAGTVTDIKTDIEAEKSIWEFVYAVEKTSGEDKDKNQVAKWKCLYCNKKYSGHIATKAVIHLVQAGCLVGPCKKIPQEKAKLFKKMYN